MSNLKSKTAALDFDASRDHFNQLYNTIGKTVATMVSIDKFTDENHSYRPDDRTHRVKDKEDPTQGTLDMAAQLKEKLCLLNPIIAVDKEDPNQGLLIASGRKRLMAARNAGWAEVPCKVLKISEIFKGLPDNYSDEMKNQLLMEVIKNIVYSESELTTGLSDRTVLSMMKDMAQNYRLRKSDFTKVMPRLGLTREQSVYRDLKRLWSVATNPELMSCVDELIGLTEAKKDKVFQVFEIKEQVPTIKNRLEAYKAELLKDPKNQGQKDIAEMKGYSGKRILQIIDEIEAKILGKSAEDSYRAPDFRIEVMKDKLTVPALNEIDLTDRSRKNIVQLVEVYYNLTEVARQVETFLKVVKPDKAGGKPNTNGGLLSGERIKHGEKYLNFIREWNMQWCSNIEEIDQYFKTEEGKVLVPDLIANSKTREQRQEMLLDEFIEMETKSDDDKNE